MDVLVSLLIVNIAITLINQSVVSSSNSIQAQTNTTGRSATENFSMLKDYSLSFNRTLDKTVDFRDITIRYPDFLNYSSVNSTQIEFVPVSDNNSYIEQNTKIGLYLFEDWYQGLSLEEIVSDFISKDRSVNLKDFKLLDLKQIELDGGIPAYKLIYNYLGGNLSMQVMYVVTLVDDSKNYDFVYSTEESSFSSYLGIANQMLERLSIDVKESEGHMSAVQPTF